MPPTINQIIIVLALIASPFVIILLIYAWNWFTTDFLFLNGITTYDNSTNTTKKAPYKPYTYKVPATPPRTYLMAYERHNPPRAEFFGRFDGKLVLTRGNYEEKYLNSVEQSHWDKQKRLNPTLADESEAKQPEVTDITLHFEQNLEKSIDFT